MRIFHSVNLRYTKFTIPYIKWHIVNTDIGIIAIIFFLAIAKNKNDKHGGIVNPKMTNALVNPQ